MNCFEILEIDKDSDKKQIKRAYAKMVKVYSPEDNPKKYQEIREAYDKALKYCNGEEKISITEVNIDYNDFDSRSTKEVKVNIYKDISDFNIKLNEIYDNINLRVDLNIWRELLDMPITWNIEGYSKIQSDLFNFISEKKYIPNEVLQVINEYFKWTENKGDLFKQYGEDKANTVIEMIEEENPISYSSIKNLSGDDLDKYLELRQKLYVYRHSTDFSKYKEELFEAYSLCNSDSEILFLIGKYYYGEERYNDAIKFLEESIKVDKNNFEAMNTMGYALHFLNKDDEAIEVLEKSIELKPNLRNSLVALGYMYYDKNQLELAKKSFIQAEEFNNVSYSKNIKNINKRLSGKTKKKLENMMAPNSMISKIKKRYDRIYRIRDKLKFIMYIFIIPAGIIYLVWQLLLVIMGQDYSQVNSLDELNSRMGKNKRKLQITLNNIRGVEYYILNELYNKELGNRLVSKDKVEEENLWKFVEKKVYVGFLNYKAIIFSNKNFYIGETIKNNEYKFKGKIYKIDLELYEYILKESNIGSENYLNSGIIIM